MASMFAFVFALILFIFIGFVIIGREDLDKIKESVVLITFFLTLGIIISLLFHLPNPTAMDVYRGKTTLEITYKDKVPIDSTVVWKNR